MLLTTAIDRFIEGYFSTCERSPKTVAAYTVDLRQFRKNQSSRRTLESLTSEVLEAWAIHLKEIHLAPASIRRKFAALKVFFNYWVRKRVLDRSPLWNLRLDFGRQRLLTRTITTEEMRRLLARARADLGGLPRRLSSTPDKTFLALRNWAILELLFTTGMRVGEASSLLLSDVILDERMLLVRGKGGRQRLAFLPDDRSFEVIRCYHRHREHLPADTCSFLLNVFSGRLSTQGIAAMLRQKAHAAGIERRLTPHMIRHTAATFLLRNGADLRIVQEFLGHTSIATTQRYTHVSKNHLQEVLSRCHPRLALRG